MMTSVDFKIIRSCGNVSARNEISRLAKMRNRVTELSPNDHLSVAAPPRGRNYHQPLILNHTTGITVLSTIRNRPH
jgi:hypothetical protein